MLILGISAFYHDSAAAFLRDGKLLYAAQEERFSRIKHDAAFPTLSIQAGLRQLGIGSHQIDCVAFYDKPLLKFDRLIQSYLAYAPMGFRSFIKAMPLWVKEKIFLRSLIFEELEKIGPLKEELPVLFNEHHKSHAASAYYPSPFNEAAVLCLDGVGEWATSSLWHASRNQLEPIWELPFPHSLGLLYSAFTYYTGFKVNSGEYKLMGLAPYGEPSYKETILEHLIDLKDDGSFHLKMEHFNYITGLTMTSPSFHEIFRGEPRKPGSEITQKEMNLAKSIQEVTEEIVLKIARSARKQTGLNNLCLAGGVALNCVANGRLLREKIFDQIWIQPAAGDAGGAVGAAFSAWHEHFQKPRPAPIEDGMQGAYLGPAFSNVECEKMIQKMHAKARQLAEKDLVSYTAHRIKEGAIVGWFQGRMEYGPRALGARSILGDPRNPKMQEAMNLKIKFRESFRPFAPAVLEEKYQEYFNLSEKSPYMMLVGNIQQARMRQLSDSEKSLFGIELLNIPKSDIPAVTHVDGSARIQTVSKATNSRFHLLLEEFEQQTGCGVLVNTSFNVRGEPIVCSPEEAYLCFMRTEMDVLCIEDFIFEKAEQPPLREDFDWRQNFLND